MAVVDKSDRYDYNLGHVLTEEDLKDPAILVITDIHDGKNDIMVIKCNVGERVLYHGLKDMAVVQPINTADGMIRWLAHMLHKEPNK